MTKEQRINLIHEVDKYRLCKGVSDPQDALAGYMLDNDIDFSEEEWEELLEICS